MNTAVIDALTRLAHELAPWAAVVLAAASAWQSWRAKKASKKNEETIVAAKEEVKSKIDAVHQTVNGRMTELLEQTAKNAHAEGIAAAQQATLENKQGG